MSGEGGSGIDPQAVFPSSEHFAHRLCLPLHLTVLFFILCLPCKSACPPTLLCASGSFCSCQRVRRVLLDASVVYLLIYMSVYMCHSGHILGISAHLSACTCLRVHVDIWIYDTPVCGVFVRKRVSIPVCV